MTLKFKNCKSCKTTLSINEFSPSKNIKDGYENKCRECRRKERKKHKNSCKQCNKIYYSAKKGSVFCSYQCTGLSKRSRVLKNCSFCQKDIEVMTNKTKRQDVFYCHQGCRTEHLKIIMYGENNPNYLREEYSCDGCNTLIKAIPSRLREQKYIFCSSDCYKENIGKYFKGENNPNWDSSKSLEERMKKRQYPEYNDWRKSVFKRDKFTCQCCGDNKGGNLAAHHILNYSEHEDLRIDINNGMTLCNICHKSFHDEYGYRNNNMKQLKEFIQVRKSKSA